MPDIPQTDAQVAPQVQPTADMPLAVTPEALGSRVGDAIGTMSEVSHKIWYDAQDRANQAASVDALNQIDAHTESSLRDPKTGLLYQQTGKDAPAATQSAMQAFDDKASKIRDGLSNDQQRLAFDRMAVARRFEYQRTLDQYEHGQTEQYAKDVHDKAIAGTVNRAVNNAGNPEAVADALNEQKALVADYGKGRMSQEAIDLQTQQHASATNLAVIEHLTATGRDMDAKAWYDAHKGDLVGKDLIQADNLTKAGSLAGQAQRTTESIVYDKDGNVDTRANIDARVRQIADPKLQDEVQARVNARLSQEHQAHLEDQKATIDQVMKAAQASPDGLTTPAAVAGLAKLDPENVEHVKAYFAKDGQIHTDPVAMNLMVKMANENPAAFLKAVQDPHVPLTYAPADYDKLSTMANEIKREGGLGKTGRDLDSDAKAVQGQLHALAIDDKDSQDQANAFRASYDEAKRVAMDANGGKALTSKDKEAIAKALAADHVSTVVRSRMNPARWLGSDTTTVSDGKTYLKPTDVMLDAMPLPGTARAKDGAYLTRSSLNAWAVDAARDKISQSDKDDLLRMSKGIDEDGKFDPAVRRRYELILEAINTAKAAAKP